MNSFSVLLEHPDKVLSPNASNPHTAKGAQWKNVQHTLAKTKARERAQFAMTNELEGKAFVRPTGYKIIWYYKGPKPDADNCLARCKAYIDGCCLAIGINDRDLECYGVYRIWDKDTAGYVEVFFTDDERDKPFRMLSLLLNERD